MAATPQVVMTIPPEMLSTGRDTPTDQIQMGGVLDFVREPERYDGVNEINRFHSGVQDAFEDCCGRPGEVLGFTISWLIHVGFFCPCISVSKPPSQYCGIVLTPCYKLAGVDMEEE